ncbi:Zinc finger C2H2-type [Trinorchestia longiramus]|nr:Zinc finger C2H2-type [Trinorchestia longiramus]
MAQKENTVVPSEQSRVTKSNKKDGHLKISSSKAATKKSSSVFTEVTLPTSKMKGRLLRKRAVSGEKTKLDLLNKKRPSNLPSKSTQAERAEKRSASKGGDDAPLRRSSRQAVRERRVWARSARQSRTSSSPEVVRPGGTSKLPQGVRKKRGRPPAAKLEQHSPALSNVNEMTTSAESANEVVKGKRGAEGVTALLRRVRCQCPVKSKMRGRCRKCSRNESRAVNGDANRIASITRAQKPARMENQCKNKTVKNDSLSEETIQSDIEQESEDEDVDIEEHSDNSMEKISNGEGILESLGVCNSADFASLRDEPHRGGGQLDVLETSRIIRESLKAPSFLTNSFAPINCVSNSNKGLSGIARSKLCPGSSMVPCNSNQSKFRNSITNKLIVSSYYKKKRSSLMPNRMKNVLNMMRERPSASSKGRVGSSTVMPEQGQLSVATQLQGGSVDAPAAALSWSKPKGLSFREKERRADAATSLIQKLRLHSSKINVSSSRKSCPTKSNALSTSENVIAKASSCDAIDQVSREAVVPSQKEVKTEISKPVHEPVNFVPSNKTAKFPSKQDKQESKLCDESVGFNSPVFYIPELPISSTISKLQARVQNHAILQQSPEMKSDGEDDDSKSLARSDLNKPEKSGSSSVMSGNCTVAMSEPKVENACSSDSKSLNVDKSYENKESKESLFRRVDVLDKGVLPRSELTKMSVQNVANEKTLLSTNHDGDDTPMSPSNEGRVPLMAALAQLVQISDTQETDESQILTIHSADNLMQVPIEASDNCQPNTTPVRMVGLEKSYVSLTGSDKNIVELKIPVREDKEEKSTLQSTTEVPRDGGTPPTERFQEKLVPSPAELPESAQLVPAENHDATEDSSSTCTTEAGDGGILKRPAAMKPGQRSLGIKTPLKCPECPMQFCTVRSLLWHFGCHVSSEPCAQSPALLQHLRVPWPATTTPLSNSADALLPALAAESVETPNVLLKSLQGSSSSYNSSSSLPSNGMEAQYNDERLSSKGPVGEATLASRFHLETTGPYSQMQSRFHDKPKLVPNINSSSSACSRSPCNETGTEKNISVPKARMSCELRPVLSAAVDETETLPSALETLKKKSKVKAPTARRARPKKVLKEIDTLTVKRGQVFQHNTPLAATSSGIVATIVGNHMVESPFCKAEMELPREAYEAVLQSKSHSKALLKIPQPRLKSSSFSGPKSGKPKPRFVNILPKVSMNSNSVTLNCEPTTSATGSSAALRDLAMPSSAQRCPQTGQLGKVKPLSDGSTPTSLKSSVNQRASDVYKNTLEKGTFMSKSDQEDEDTVVMINPNLGLRMISKADASSFGKTSSSSAFDGQNYAGFSSFGSSSFLSNPPNSLTIVPQVGESASKTRNSSPPTPDILTIVPQMNSSKQINADSPKSQASILTAAGALSPSCGMKLVLAQPASEQCSTPSRALELSFGSRGGDVDSDEEIMVIDEKPEEEQKVDPISMCTVAIDEDASTPLTGNTSSGDKSSSSLENEIVDVTSIDDSCEVRDLLLNSNARENERKQSFPFHSFGKIPASISQKSPDLNSGSCSKPPSETLTVSSSDLPTGSDYSCSTYASSSPVPSISVYKSSTPYSAISNPVPSALTTAASSALSSSISSFYPSSVLSSPQSARALNRTCIPPFTLDTAAAAPPMSQHSVAVSPVVTHSFPLTTTPVVTPFTSHRLLSIASQVIPASQSPLILPSASVISTCAAPLASTISIPSLLPIPFPSQSSIALSPLSSPFTPSLALTSIASNTSIPVPISSITSVSVPTFTPVSLPTLPSVSVTPLSTQPLSSTTNLSSMTSPVPPVPDVHGRPCQISGCLSPTSGTARSFSNFKSCNNSFTGIQVASTVHVETSRSAVPPLTPISPKIQPAVCLSASFVPLSGGNAFQNSLTVTESIPPITCSMSSVSDAVTSKVCSNNGTKGKSISKVKLLSGVRAPRSTLKSRFTSRNSILRKYCCPHCDKRFGWSTDLKRHIIIHTGERPFKCDTCCNSFTRKFLLENHISRAHSS